MISFEPLVRARGAVITAFLIVAAMTAPGLLLLRMDNSPEGFFVQDHEALAVFERLERDFGRDRGLRIVIEGDAVWTRAGLEELAALESGLSVADDGLGGVYAAAGPWRHHRWHLGAWPPANAEALRRLAVSDALDRNAGWVSPDGGAVTVIVGLFAMLPARQGATLDAIDARVRAAQEALRARAADDPTTGDVLAYTVGLPVVSRAVDRAQLRVLRVVIPSLVVVAAALMGLLFRSVSGVLLPLGLVSVTQVVVFGAMGYAGQRIDFVTLLLVPLTFVITLATGVHVLAYQRRLLAGGSEPRAALLETYRVKAWPVLWTGMTTSVGFASLAASAVPSVRALGLWTAFGIAFMTLAALSFYPALLSFVGGRSPKVPRGLAAGHGSWIRAGVHRAVTRPGAIYVAFGAVALAAALGVPRLAVDTSVLSYFAPGHALRRQVDRVEALGLPAVNASLVIEAPASAPGFDDPTALQKLSALARELRAQPLVTGVLSAGDLVADVARHQTDGPAGVAPGAEALIAARRRMGEVPDLRDLLAAVLAEGGSRTRLVLFTPMRGFDALEPMYHAAEAAARRAFPDARVAVTGEFPLVLTAQRSLLRTMVLSLLATFTVISVTLRLLLGSTSLTLRSLLPNLWPVLIVLGAQGWLGIPIDSTTVMVAAVVLGLAVDDTLHTLGHVRLRARDRRDDDRGSGPLIEGSVTEVAGGHVMTSVILCLGFLVPMSSELLPVARFGMLSALAIAAALAADLLLVPALLAGARRRTLALLAPGE